MAYRYRFILIPTGLGQHFIGSSNVGRMAFIWGGTFPANRVIRFGGQSGDVPTYVLNNPASVSMGVWCNMYKVLDEEIFFEILGLPISTSALEVIEDSRSDEPFKVPDVDCLYHRTVPIGITGVNETRQVMLSNPRRVTLIVNAQEQRMRWGTSEVEAEGESNLQIVGLLALKLRYADFGRVIRESVWIRSNLTNANQTVTEVYY